MTGKRKSNEDTNDAVVVPSNTVERVSQQNISATKFKTSQKNKTTSAPIESEEVENDECGDEGLVQKAYDKKYRIINRNKIRQYQDELEEAGFFDVIWEIGILETVKGRRYDLYLDDDVEITDEHLKKLGLAELGELHLEGCNTTNLSAKGFEHLKKTDLFRLTLKDIKLNNKHFDSIFKNCSDLYHLDVYDMELPKSDPFRNILKLKNLKTLFITIEMLTDENIIRLSALKGTKIFMEAIPSEELQERMNGSIVSKIH